MCIYMYFSTYTYLCVHRCTNLLTYVDMYVDIRVHIHIGLAKYDPTNVQPPISRFLFGLKEFGL